MDSPLWWHESAAGGVLVAFTSVRAGNLGTHVGEPGEAAENRLRLERHLGLRPYSVRYLRQVHSPHVLDASAVPREEVSDQDAPEGDAWVSPSGAEPIAVMGADCPPVLFAGRAGSGTVTAAAHAGRPGLLGGVLENTLEAMCRHAPELAGAGRITAWIGPGACGRCYEIPEDMVAEIAAERPAIRSRTSWGTSALDLRAEALRILEDAGVAVVDLKGCTIEDGSLFSHRRSSQQGTRAGRIAGIIFTRD